MSVYGKSIYGTKPGPFEPVDDYYGSVYKGNIVYIHLLNKQERLLLPPLSGKLLSCKILNGKDLSFTLDKQGISLDTKLVEADESVVTLELKLNKKAL